MTGFIHTTTAVPYLHHVATTARAMHGFFGTAGGVSSGVYASLNCGFGSDDDAALVARNRDLVRTEMDLAPGRMAAVYQVHGQEAVMADDLFDENGMVVERASLPRADGLVTTTPGVGLTILTADCLALLLVDDAGRVAGACHAGWRGAAAGIVGTTVALMRDQGAGRITALIGPTIRQPSYQVGAEMRTELLDSVPTSLRDLAAQCFRPDDCRTDDDCRTNGDPRYRFDLPGLVRHQLAADDVADILDCGVDTYTGTGTDGDLQQPGDALSISGPDSGSDSGPDSGPYFSHRRATHAGDADSGRQIAVMALTG